MPMICPKCNRAYEQQLQCPTCDARLLYHAQLQSNVELSPSSEPSWQHTPWGRILVAAVVSQGLAQGLQLFFVAGLQASGDAAGLGDWNNPFHVILIQTLHAFCLVLGGIMAGAGLRRGVFFGSVVGFLHGLIALGIRQWQGDLLPEVSLCAVPALHMAFGAVGGLVGSLIWRPLPTVQPVLLPVADQTLRGSFMPGRAVSLFAGKVAWVRVLLGTGLAVSGVWWSAAILRFTLENAPTRLTVESASQFAMFTWEIAGLATFVGAAFAGATTTNGFKQGLCVGLAAAVVLTGLHLSRVNPDLDRAVIIATSTLILSAGGGWFGGQLFPKINRHVRPGRPRLYSEAG
jgi:hypothetical protein